MSKFQPRGADEDPQIQKMTIGGWDGPTLQKNAINPEADFADVSSRVINPDTGAAAHELTRRIAQVYRRVTAGQTGVHELSLEERRAMRDKIVAAMLHEWDSPFPNDYSRPTEAIFNLASLLAGLTDDLEAPTEKPVAKSAHSAEMTAIRQSIAKLKCPSVSATDSTWTGTAFRGR